MYKSMFAIMLCSVSLHGALISRVAILCSPALQQGPLVQSRTLTHDALPVELSEKFQSMLLKNDYRPSQVLSYAIGVEDVPLIEGLLKIGVTLRWSQVEDAVSNDKHELVALLLPKVRDFHWPPAYAHRFSFEMIKRLLAHKSKISAAHGNYSPTGDLVAVLRYEERYQSGQTHRAFVLDDAKKAALLEKVIVFAQAGDPLDFSVINPMSSKESMKRYRYWSCVVRRDYAQGDWTFGVFPELVRYLHAVSVYRKATSTAAEKSKAQKKMAKIMAQYGIHEKDVAINVMEQPEHSRLQEA